MTMHLTGEAMQRRLSPEKFQEPPAGAFPQVILYVESRQEDGSLTARLLEMDEGRFEHEKVPLVGGDVLDGRVTRHVLKGSEPFNLSPKAIYDHKKRRMSEGPALTGSVVEMQPGDIVAAYTVEPFRADHDAQSPMVVHAVSAEVRGNAACLEAAVTFAEATLLAPSHQIHAYPMDRDALEFQMGARDAAHQLDTALILAVPTWDYSAGKQIGTKLHGSILGHTGAYLYWQVNQVSSNLDEAGIQEPDEPGLYVIRNGKSWAYHDSMVGEYDAGMDGDQEPATEADLAAFGVSRENVIADALDAMDWCDAPEPADGQDLSEWLRQMKTQMEAVLAEEPVASPKP